MAADLAITGAVIADQHLPEVSWDGDLRALGEPMDVLIEHGRISSITPTAAGTGTGSGAGRARRTLDGEAALVMPGLVDIQVHFRTPPFEGAPAGGEPTSERIASGGLAAVMGGVTACLMMPNTDPPIDNEDILRQVLELGRQSACDIFSSACVSVGRSGSEPVDFEALYEAGVRVFTDDGDAVANEALMRAALQATLRLESSVISQHAEAPELIREGVINAGPVAEQLGVAGRDAKAEIEMVARDLALAAETGGRYHVLHLSTGEALAQVRQAKAQGLAVTAEVTPQHLCLTEKAVLELGADAKMNPPLRTSQDVAALRAGLADGALDAVATDHAPHHSSLKDQPLSEAPPGMLGVETLASVLWTEMVQSGEITPRRFVEVASVAPARIASIAAHGRPVAVGEPANLMVFDPAQRWQVDRQRLSSLSQNTPWHGRTLIGRARHTIVGGAAVVEDNEAC